MEQPNTQVVRALQAPDQSVRLRAAMAIGSAPAPCWLPLLVERCRIEPDFHVREMLTWAIIQLPRETTVPHLLPELDSDVAQARSQALHTLSKIGVPEAWAKVWPLLVDADDEVARTAWRVAVDIVPAGEEGQLAAVLIGQLGRGDIEVYKSLARALAALAIIHEPVVELLQSRADQGRGEAADHARATLTVLRDPGASFDGALADARRQRLG